MAEHAPITELLEALDRRRRAVSDAGRPDAVERQHAAGKLTARERIDALADPGSAAERGALVEPSRDMPRTRDIVAPADGVVTSSVLVDGRAVEAVAFDFTAAGGSNGRIGSLKLERSMQRSIDHGTPLVMVFDGGGHRIQEGLDSRHFASGTPLFALQARLSGWAPIVTVIAGSGFAGPSNFAALSDLVIMVRGSGTMGVAGPALVLAAIGEEATKEQLGGADVQADRHGLADLVCEDDIRALAAARAFLSYLPSNASMMPPVVASADPPDRRDDRLVGVVPTNSRRAYDMRSVVDVVVDDASTFEIKATYAKNIITSLARINGHPVGIIANQPAHLSGALDSAACEKAAHFVSICDAFGLPLVYFIDVPGFMVGTAAEASGLARRSGRMLYELGQATVPRLSVVIRKGYGLAYIAMCGGRSFDADLCVAWPTAEIAAMSIEGAVDVAYRREIDKAVDPAAHRRALLDEFRDQVGALRAGESFGIDDVIDPRETRAVLAQALDRFARRAPGRPSWPPKRHGISPI